MPKQDKWLNRYHARLRKAREGCCGNAATEPEEPKKIHTDDVMKKVVNVVEMFFGKDEF